MSGLRGSGLALQLRTSAGAALGAPLTVAAAGTVAFPTRISAGARWYAEVATEPRSPTQRCTIAGGGSRLLPLTMPAAPVTLAVTCK